MQRHRWAPRSKGQKERIALGVYDGPSVHVTQWDLPALRAALAAGNSFSTIARRLGVSRERVRQVAARHLGTTAKDWRPAQDWFRALARLTPAACHVAHLLHAHGLPIRAPHRYARRGPNTSFTIHGIRVIVHTPHTPVCTSPAKPSSQYYRVGVRRPGFHFALLPGHALAVIPARPHGHRYVYLPVRLTARPHAATWQWFTALTPDDVRRLFAPASD
jgi:hypothetical protein